MLDALLEEVSRYVPAFSGKCEDCGSAETREVTLLNGVPGYHCLACQMRVAADKRRETEEYRAKEANYVPRILAGVVAAAAAGTIWGEFATCAEVATRKWDLYLHAAVTFSMCVRVGWAVFNHTR